MNPGVFKVSVLAFVLLLVACAPPLGGISGDPTAVEHDRAGQPVRLSRAVETFAAAPARDIEAKAAVAPTRNIEAKAAVAPAPTVESKAAAAPSNDLGAVPGRIIKVGLNGSVPTVAQAARVARDGDIVEVQAGEYRGDVAVWTQKHLTIRAVGGRAVLIADGKSAEGKGIWVIRNGSFQVDGFDFIGSRVDDGNGAGIRFERGTLLVRNSRFLDNQMGLLTGNDPNSELMIERCEFSGPRDGSHWYHNLYAGRIARFTLVDSYSHDARVGHLVKSRARESIVTGNRLVDGRGTASYELEFPEGGVVTVRDNVIEQGPLTENPVIVSFGAEGYRWPRNELSMSDNTLVNRAPHNATFVRVAPGHASARLTSNVWVGAGRVQIPEGGETKTNRAVTLEAWRKTATK